jgi:hypothetical protein
MCVTINKILIKKVSNTTFDDFVVRIMRKKAAKHKIWNFFYFGLFLLFFGAANSFQVMRFKAVNQIQIQEK